MNRRAVARGRPIDLAGVGLSIGDEFGDGLGWHRWVYFHHVRDPNEAGDRRDLGDKVEVELRIERRVDRVRRIDKEKRVAIRRSADDELSAASVARTGRVLDDELLAEAF